MRISNLMLLVTLGLTSMTGMALAQTALPPGTAAIVAPGTAGVRHCLRDEFAAANTTGDGHLTLAQAQGSGMRMVARNFAAIDAEHKGFVTWADIRAFRHARRAARQQAPGQ
jgi:hypothetical protein